MGDKGLIPVCNNEPVLLMVVNRLMDKLLHHNKHHNKQQAGTKPCILFSVSWTFSYKGRSIIVRF